MQLLRIREVVKLTGLSRMTIYRMEKAGDFPSRRRLGKNSVAWLEADVETWISARPVVSRSTHLRHTTNRLANLAPPLEPGRRDRLRDYG